MKIIITTGYMGSGSSAVTDLLKEFDDFSAPNDSFEYIFLHCPNGVFDLEDKLLIGNNVIRSDEALHEFRNTMKDLYNLKNFWPGQYKKRISKDFLKNVDLFVEALTLTEFRNTYWYYQQIPNNVFMQLNRYFSRFLKIITFNKFKIHEKLRYKNMHISFPTKDEFYEHARVFIKNTIDSIECKTSNVILDQLLLPHNLFRLENYFTSSTRIIVVQRDPRDVFIMNKYFWAPCNNAVAYPLEVEDFVIYYRRMREAEKSVNNNKILRINFEDLIYHYKKTLEVIYQFLDITENEHLLKMSFFDPNVSIKNTQLFKLKEEYKFESDYIYSNLREFIYEFPDDIQINRNEDELF